MAQKNRKRKQAKKPPMPILEGPGKRDYQRELRWLLDFLNQDIRYLPSGEFLKVMHEALIFIYEDQYRDKADAQEQLGKALVDNELDRKAISEIQKLMKEHLGLIKERSEQSFKYQDPYYVFEDANFKYDVIVDKDEIKLIPANKLIRHYMGTRANFWDGTGRYREISFDEGATADEEYIKTWYRDNSNLKKNDSNFEFEKCLFFSKCWDTDINNSILIALTRLLEKFPLDCIRQCPNCGQYFTSTKKKESPLCRLCLKKENTYKWRKENRPTYNEYQRNLQKGVNDERPTEIRERLNGRSDKDEK